MPDIELRDLNRSIGTELFADTESFLEDLSEDAANIVGGTSNKFVTSTQAPIQTTAIRPQDMGITTHYIFPHGGSTDYGLITEYIHQQPIHPRPIHPRPIHPRPIYTTFVTNDA